MEIYFWENLKKYKTENPMEANLFLIPLFTSKYNNEDVKNIIENIKLNMDRIFNEFPYWKNSIEKNIINHFWFSYHEKHVLYTIPELYLKNMIILTTASDRKSYPLYFNIKKDISLPPALVYSFSEILEKNIISTHKRNLDVYMMAQARNICENREKIILEILKDERIKKNKKWFIRRKKITSKNIDEYYKYMQNSKYGIFTRGDCVWSPRLIEILIHGCIPIIINNDYVLPFEKYIDWKSFSVIINEQNCDTLYDIINNIDENEYKMKQKKIFEITKHLLFNIKPVYGDAFYMVMLQLFDKI